LYTHYYDAGLDDVELLHQIVHCGVYGDQRVSLSMLFYADRPTEVSLGVYVMDFAYFSEQTMVGHVLSGVDHCAM